MPRSKILSILMAAAVVAAPAQAQQWSPEQHEAGLAYAQCIRDNGYAEFPDPTPEGGMRFRITPDGAPRFEKAADACRDLAPEGMRGEDPTPEQIDALIGLAQCVREQGIEDFPDPDAKGGFNLRGVGIGPADTSIQAAIAHCNAQSGPQGIRIMIGG